MILYPITLLRFLFVNSMFTLQFVLLVLCVAVLVDKLLERLRRPLAAKLLHLRTVLEQEQSGEAVYLKRREKKNVKTSRFTANLSYKNREIVLQNSMNKIFSCSAAKKFVRALIKTICPRAIFFANLDFARLKHAPYECFINSLKKNPTTNMYFFGQFSNFLQHFLFFF
jgi:hypothetical protein